MRGLNLRMWRVRAWAFSMRESWALVSTCLLGKSRGERRAWAYLFWIEPSELENHALERAEGVPYVEAESNALAQEKLAREDLLGCRVRQLIRESAPVSAILTTLLFLSPYVYHGKQPTLTVSRRSPLP